MADCLQDLGRSAEALPLLQQALEMRQRIFSGHDHPDVATSLNNVAMCLQALGRPAEALPMLRQALKMCQRLFPDQDHPDVATGMSNVAVCLDSLGRPAEALPIYQRALKMSQRLFPDQDHPAVAMGLNNLAVCLQDLGRPAEALPLYRRVLKMSQRHFPDQDHPDVASSLNNLASCLQRLGRPAKALPMLQLALKMRQRHFPDQDHPDVASSLNNVAMCLQALGRSAEALPMYQRALKMRQRLFPDQDHPAVATSLSNMAMCLWALGRPADALPMLRQALKIHQRFFPDQDHPNVASSLSDVAVCLQDLGRPAEALPLHQQALAMSQRLFPDQDHPDVASSLNNVAVCLQDLCRPAEALPRFGAAVAMARRLNAPRLFICETNLANLYLELSRPEEAVKRLDEAITGIEALRRSARSLGERELGTYFGYLKRFGTFDLMVRAQVRLGRADEALRYLEKGRARGLLDLLERSRFDPLEAVKARAAEQHDAARLDRIEALQTAVAEADQRVGDLEYRVATLRQRKTAAESEERQRRAEIDRLSADLRSARAAQRKATRQWFRQVAEVLPESRAREPAEIQSLLSGEQRMLIYSVTDWDGLLLVVPPAGKAIETYVLSWPDGQAVTAESLAASVRAYLRAMVGEGYATQRSQLQARLASLESTAPGAAPPDEARRRDLTAAMERVERKSLALRESEDSVPDGADLGRLGARLFSTLIPPEVWAEIAGAKQVFVVPHGALNRLPFETLVVDGGATARERRFWLDVGPSIAYGPSGSVLWWSQRRREAQLRQDSRGAVPLYAAVALGDPIFSRTGHAIDAEPLPDRGVLVLTVPADSAGAVAGLARGDVILSYGAQAVPDDLALQDRITAMEKAVRSGAQTRAPVMLEVWRAGGRRELSVLPGERLGVEVATASPAEALSAIEKGRFDLEFMAAERTGLIARYGGLMPLPGTRREVLSIYRALTGRPFESDGEQGRGAVAASSSRPAGVRLLLGEEATKPDLYAWAPRARYLHLATHQLADETATVSYSSLALTLPRVMTVADNGFLRLIDLLRYWRDRITGCELVVLSACETQRGRLQRDEGVYALPWGFQYAGAPTVIASLWRVNDASTAVLMSDLYRRLRAGSSKTVGGKLSVFTAARKTLRQSHPEPYFWAPFIYIGDPR